MKWLRRDTIRTFLVETWIASPDIFFGRQIQPLGVLSGVLGQGGFIIAGAPRSMLCIMG